MTALLTVRQPFASAIISGAKRIENRPRGTRIRGQIGIHAGQLLHERALDLEGLEFKQVEALPRGVVIGTVQLVGAHHARSMECRVQGCWDDPYAEMPTTGALWHWELDQPREYVTPIKAKGQLGFWHPGPSLEHLMTIADVKP